MDAERRQHTVTHTPYEPWCAQCVRNRGRDKAHQWLEHAETDEAFASFDYVSVSERDGSQLGANDRSRISVLLGVERTTASCALPPELGQPEDQDKETSPMDLLKKVRI